MAIFYEDVLRGLLAAQVRFVLVGGVAVILQGVPRATANLDLVIDLEEVNVQRFVETMEQLGFVPRPPVPAIDLTSAVRRREWVDEKGMLAFTSHRPGKKLDEVDVLIEAPIPFAELSAGAEVLEAEGLRLPVASAPHLIRMKKSTGRAQDSADANALRRLLDATSNG